MNDNKVKPNITAQKIIADLCSMANEKQKQQLQRFFKTGKGQYGEGDLFLGLKVPQTRQIVKKARLQIQLSEIEKMLYSKWHEVRLCALLLLVEEMTAASHSKSKNNNQSSLANKRTQIVHFYLHHAKQANNWDLVDLSCTHIIGAWLLQPMANGQMPNRNILDKLAQSKNLWLQRIAIVSTLQLIRNGQFSDTLRIANLLLSHQHDLIHKAIGWTLREIGKRDIKLLRTYLNAHHQQMARTTLRYAIEKMNDSERRYWLSL